MRAVTQYFFHPITHATGVEAEGRLRANGLEVTGNVVASGYPMTITSDLPDTRDRVRRLAPELRYMPNWPSPS